ncbi:MAG TPA: pentapeptide repeat-containing protein [Blastocatellia bacterium]|nr:pentapeptide repeat-containing protein [Blastocatellia bacterium]
MIEINGKLRSHIELRFVARLYPCPGCGNREVDRVETFRAGGRLLVIVSCQNCQSSRKFRFTTRNYPLDVTPSRHELGGSEPSSVIRPAQFVGEFDRLSQEVVWEPEGLAPAEWRANLSALHQAATCLVELLKFIPDGADAVPAAAHDKAGCADAQARPERYRRARLAAELDRYRELFARHERDGPRIYALEPPVLPPRGELSSRTLETHLQWVRRGRTGDGRLDIANVNAAGVNVGAKDMSGSLLDGVIFERANVSFSTFERAELTGVRMIQTDLGSCSFVGARLLGCDFLGANLSLGKLDDAVISGGRFARVSLYRCLWRRARAAGVDFSESVFCDSALDDSVFVDCDLRGAKFSLHTKGILGSTAQTRFERCDLRDTQWEGRNLDNAVFVDCRFHGASGQPERIVGVRIERPDLSPDGDGRMIGCEEDVFALWRGQGAGK